MKKIDHWRVSIILLFLLFCISGAWADRGSFVMRPITMTENINVFDAGQKAIICWNRNEELLILSTDKYASAAAKVLEFMPLPSKPSQVEEVEETCFNGIASLITAHRPQVSWENYPKRASTMDKSEHAPSIEPAVEIVFHKKIGAHDINIAKVNRLDGFCEWVKKFYTMQQMQYRQEDVAKLFPVVKDYLKREYFYYVFDVIELSTEKNSVKPILYKFASNALYFPLKVTTLAEGVTDIALYLFTPFKTDIWGTGTGFKSGFYTVNGTVSYSHPIKFTVTNSEMQQVSEAIYKFMTSGKPLPVWFSMAKFNGSTKELTQDFVMKPPQIATNSGYLTGR